MTIHSVIVKDEQDLRHRRSVSGDLRQRPRRNGIHETSVRRTCVGYARSREGGSPGKQHGGIHRAAARIRVEKKFALRKSVWPQNRFEWCVGWASATLLPLSSTGDRKALRDNRSSTGTADETLLRYRRGCSSAACPALLCQRQLSVCRGRRGEFEPGKCAMHREQRNQRNRDSRGRFHQVSPYRPCSSESCWVS